MLEDRDSVLEQKSYFFTGLVCYEIMVKQIARKLLLVGIINRSIAVEVLEEISLTTSDKSIEVFKWNRRKNFSSSSSSLGFNGYQESSRTLVAMVE